MRTAIWKPSLKRAAVSFDLWWYILTILRVGVFSLHTPSNKLWALRGRPFHFLLRGLVEWFDLGIFFSNPFIRKFFFFSGHVHAWYFPPLYNILYGSVNVSECFSSAHIMAGFFQHSPTLSNEMVSPLVLSSFMNIFTLLGKVSAITRNE